MSELETMIVGVVLESEDFVDVVNGKFDEFIYEKYFEHRVLKIVKLDETDFDSRVIDLIKDNTESPSVDSGEIKDIIDEHIGDVSAYADEITRLNVDNSFIRDQLANTKAIIGDLNERLVALEAKLEGEEFEEPQRSFWWDVMPVAVGIFAGQFAWTLFN